MSGYQSYNGEQGEGYSQGRGGSPSARVSGGGFSPGAQTSGQKDQKRREGQSLTPVTIRQLLDCPNDGNKFKLDNKELAQVTVVGNVISSEEKPNNISYTLDDGTGVMGVQLYIDSHSDKSPIHAENTYIRVFGNLRMVPVNGIPTRTIIGFQAKPVLDHNEIAYHSADAMYTHLVNTKGALKGIPTSSTTSSSSQYTSSHTQDVHMNTSSSHSIPQQQLNGEFTPVQQQVLRVFELDAAASGDSGTSINTVRQQLSHISQQDIDSAIEFLSNEGHLYSTIDENHYKSTATA